MNTGTNRFADKPEGTFREQPWRATKGFELGCSSGAPRQLTQSAAGTCRNGAYRRRTDVIAYDKATDQYVLCDCSAESPAGRRSLCFDGKRLPHARRTSRRAARWMRQAMGVELMTEQQYRQLQQLGQFDLKTSSWVHTRRRVPWWRALLRPSLRQGVRLSQRCRSRTTPPAVFAVCCAFSHLSTAQPPRRVESGCSCFRDQTSASQSYALLPAVLVSA